MNYIFLDNGFEEIEAITTIDLLRRANIALTTVSVTGQDLVTGAHYHNEAEVFRVWRIYPHLAFTSELDTLRWDMRSGFKSLRS